jgi:hypothetical protein
MTQRLKLKFAPGINTEVTETTNFEGWVDGNLIRFRQGFPEQMGGWQRLGPSTFTGVCRSLHQWITLSFKRFTGVGTNVKFFIEQGTDYYDITPLRVFDDSTTVRLPNNPIATDGTTNEVTITHHASNVHGSVVGSYVTISEVPSGNIGGVPHTDLNKEHVITEIVSTTKFKIEVATTSTSATSGGGGGVDIQYQINVGPDSEIPEIGWTSSSFSSGEWNGDGTGTETLRVWNQANYGEDLILATRGGELFYWDASAATLDSATFIGTRAVALKNVKNGTAITLGSNPFATTSGSKTITVTDATGLRVYESGQHVTLYYPGLSTIGGLAASKFNGRFKIQSVDSGSNTFTYETDVAAGSTATGGGSSATAHYELSAEVPVVQDSILVSDASRFVFCFGCNAFGDTTEAKNPLLIRWSDQEDVYDWRPRSTNQAGDLQLSQGTEIVTAIQSRQEILVFTDSALYSLQYVGAPVVWGSQLVGSNISVASSKAAAYANGVAYWMGKGKFYKYDGTVQALRCDVQKRIFEELDQDQYEQVFAGTLEEYHEIWWFYVSNKNNAKVAPDKYVVYNYDQDIWYFGDMSRSAWFDSPINDYPLAATDTYNLVEQENGDEDGQEATTTHLPSFITSGRIHLAEGNQYMFIKEFIADFKFTPVDDSQSKSIKYELIPLEDPGYGYAYTGINKDASNNTYSSSILYSNPYYSRSNEGTFTTPSYVRMRARQIMLRVLATSSTKGMKWQLGTPSLSMRPDGRRGRL